MVLFLRSIMYDLGIPQQAASIIFEDNEGATAMANAQKPTTRTQHMDIKYFALAEWVKHDLMILERVNTAINTADHFTNRFSIGLYSTAMWTSSWATYLLRTLPVTMLEHGIQIMSETRI
ncbi:hypothetical protein ACHAXN_003819 [Cyclotella atomus]